jgi:hypothetical protein
MMQALQYCREQSAECHRLLKIAQSEAEAVALRNISQSLTRLAGQIDRYNALVREQRRVERKYLTPNSLAIRTGPSPGRMSDAAGS